MRNNTNSSVVFEVWVDDKRLYESDVFYGDSEHHAVCIPITGAKELKLIVTDANIQTYWGDYSEWAMARLTKSPIIEEETNPDHVGDNTGGSATSQFEDVKGHWAENAIKFVVERNIFKGTSANKFEPNMTITRGMFVTLLGRVANIEPFDYKQSSFSDVPNAAYYMPYVEWAKERGIVSGISATKYAPNDLVTREQMAVMLDNFAKAYGITLPEIVESKTFADASEIASWSMSAVYTMQKAGIITGKTGNRFDPKGKATRAEGAAVFQRFIQIIEGNHKNR